MISRILVQIHYQNGPITGVSGDAIVNTFVLIIKLTYMNGLLIFFPATAAVDFR